MQVIGMIDSPARLVRPSFMLRVARTNRRRHTGVQGSCDPADSPSVGSGKMPSR
jgi:hypothetical protein